MTSVSDNKERILLESKLRQLEEFIKELMVCRIRFIQHDQMLREAVRTERAAGQSANEHLLHVMELCSQVPRPIRPPTLPLFLLEPGGATSPAAKASSEKRAAAKPFPKIGELGGTTDLTALKTKANSLPHSWLLAPELMPRFARKMEEIRQEI